MKYIQRYLTAILAMVFGGLFLGIMEINAQACICEEEFQNCALPLTRLNGQGYTLSGVTGGLTLDTSVAAVDPLGWISGSVNVSENTAILVIDSFMNPATETVSFLIPDFDLSGIATDADLEDAYRTGLLTHGALVFNHISALIDGALGINSGVPDDVSGTVEWATSGKRLVVKMVHALEYDVPTPTLNVANAITQAMVDLNASVTDPDQLFTRFILNMSFAILPCEIAENYQQYYTSIGGDPDGLFDQYREDVAEAQGYYRSQLITPTEHYRYPDPLHYLIGQCAMSQSPDTNAQEKSFQDADYEELPEVIPPIEIECDPTGQSLVFVGSAGNSSLPFAFYPAAWEEVTGVSASEDGTLADYSNYNTNIGLAGGWFSLYAYTDSNPSQLTLLNDPPIFYRGTSFSGPVESVCEALNLDRRIVSACQSIPNP